jgi:hypothetical protein
MMHCKKRRMTIQLMYDALKKMMKIILLHDAL